MQLSFLVVYLIAGFIDQTNWGSDFYPFSDWYLFSYANREGAIYGIKFYDRNGQTQYLKDTNTPISKDVLKAVRFLRRDEKEKAEEIMRTLTNKIGLRGQITIIERKIERMEFYKNGTWIEENEIATFTFE